MREKEDGKVRLLIVSTEMHMGGVTTALLALLRSIDYGRLDVDLLLYDHHGVLQSEIPPEVRVLPPAAGTGGGKRLRKMLSPRYVLERLKALWLESRGKRLEGLQVRARNGARYTPPLDGDYDLAISFIEFWPLYYTADRVRARHKLAWIHVDYKNCGLSVRRDEGAFPAYDRIVMVSEECVRNFRTLSAKFADRAVYLPNLVSEKVIRDRAASAAVASAIAASAIAASAIALPDRGGRKLVTVARLQLSHKGLDRGVRAFDRLRRRGLMEGVTWSIIGDGEDRETLRALIERLGRGKEIFLLGQMLNPLPLVARADAFLMTSWYEGKPMAVTEAQILGLPVLATRYASASEQITDGVDGLIVENSEAGIERGLERLLETPGLLEKMSAQVRRRHYGNETEMERYYDLFREVGVPVSRKKGAEERA